MSLPFLSTPPDVDELGPDRLGHREGLLRIQNRLGQVKCIERVTSGGRILEEGGDSLETGKLEVLGMARQWPGNLRSGGPQIPGCSPGGTGNLHHRK